VGVLPRKLKSLVKTRFASSMSLPYTMEGNNHWCFKVVCQVHKFGQLPKLFMILQGHGSNNVCWTKVQTTSYFLMPFLQPYHSYVKCKWILGHQIPMRLKTLMVNFKYPINTWKIGHTSSKSLLFIYAFISTPQGWQHVGYDVRPLL
jgi:hypothetical protein